MAARDREATEAEQTAGPIRLSGGSQDGTRIPSPEYRAQPPHYEQLPDGRWVFGRYEGTPGSGEAHFQEYEDPDLAAWKNTTSFAVDMLPLLGSAKSAGQILTGKDLVTGEPINRSIEAANLALGVLPGGKLLRKMEQKAAEAAVKGEAGDLGRQILYHYTNEAGAAGIVESNSINPSLWHVGTKDVRYGNGQYVSDIAPGSKTPSQLSREFLGQPFNGHRFTHFIEIDATGLGAIQGRPGVYAIPNDVPLDLTDRILRIGKVIVK